MAEVRIQLRASHRLDEIYRHTREHWGDGQAERYITGLFDVFSKIARHEIASKPIPAAFGHDGFYVRYERHVIYWRYLSNADIGIVTILHERMHHMAHFRDDVEN
ncbi:type II toxin-antitoxin system RelE/ParE family toxin [Woodsholea maritima]|uniref:type II toxin-antitoxin system RelE/ParE family toxin n=1 Tax=Woodsholea maritima TaxID=240237 RepID=UPI0004771DB1